MSLLEKLGIVGLRTPGRATPFSAAASHLRQASGSVAAVGYSGVNAPRGGNGQESTRVSNGLKEFLWNLDGVGRGRLLELGPAWQTTLSFFIERGFRVSSEDLLRAWKDSQIAEEKKLQMAVGGALDGIDMTVDGRAVRFLEANLQFPASSFDAILLWDLLDYFEPALARRVVAALTDLLRPGGVIFAMFHSRKPESFHRYRVVDSMTLQMLPATEIYSVQRVYQNREIQDLFRPYRTMKSFVGRDQLREVLFVK
jgi:SAM-dependent methyltransferase